MTAMALTFQNKIQVCTLSPKPEVTIWYSRIPIIIRSILTKRIHHISKPLVNEIFTKDDFINNLFNDDEINTINSFKALKKQLEWMSGRYLIKQMIQHIFLKNIRLDQITLSYLDQGAPYLTHNPEIPISLSHSNDYTTIACSHNKGQTLGIDIEKIKGKPDAGFLKIAFTKDEVINMGDVPAKIFKHWTIKEAYLKYIKKGFNESLQKVEVIHDEILHNKKGIDVDIYSRQIDNDYFISLVSD
jgi:4'-phosphopantetheinyl transferase